MGLILLNLAPAYAQTLCDNGPAYIPRPVSNAHAITSNMGPRDLTRSTPTNPECSGQSYSPVPGASRNHRGTDYATPCGTKISGPPAGCVKTGPSTIRGYGNVAKFDCGNGIKLQYSHLANNSYNAASNTITTGDSGIGGCHLDYIMTIDGTAVDAQCSTGKPSGLHSYGCRSDIHGKQCPFGTDVDVCDKDNQAKLKEHSDSVFNGGGNQYDVDNGSTAPNSEDSSGETGAVINQGTQGLDGSSSGGTGTSDPLEEEQPDPKEDEPTPPTPSDEYFAKATKPVCDNSTCITRGMIDNAKNKRAKYDELVTYDEFLSADKECKKPIETGVEVYRQAVSAGSGGRIVKYKDAFCSNAGCTYKTDGAGKSGECE